MTPDAALTAVEIVHLLPEASPIPSPVSPSGLAERVLELAKIELPDTERAAADIGGGLEVDPDVAGALGADLDDDRLDEDLDARNVEFVDDAIAGSRSPAARR